jgi:predicted transcriptional regulator
LRPAAAGDRENGKEPKLMDYGRRERQIMDVVYQLGEASVADVLAQLPDPPSYSAVRRMLAVLEEKGHLKHRHDKNRYIYYPRVAREKASRRALKQLVKTFFDNSPTKAMAALLDSSTEQLSAGDLEELHRLIQKARQEGR